MTSNYAIWQHYSASHSVIRPIFGPFKLFDLSFNYLEGSDML